jgi:hypothetical protein
VTATILPGSCSRAHQSPLSCHVSSNSSAAKTKRSSMTEQLARRLRSAVREQLRIRRPAPHSPRQGPCVRPGRGPCKLLRRGLCPPPGRAPARGAPRGNESEKDELKRGRVAMFERCSKFERVRYWININTCSGDVTQCHHCRQSIHITGLTWSISNCKSP